MVPTEIAKQDIKESGLYKRAFEMGSLAKNNGRPGCLLSGGFPGAYEDPDFKILKEMGGNRFPFTVVLGNAWFAGYDSQMDLFSSADIGKCGAR